MALIKINNRSSEDNAIHGRRNLVINGAMQVAQRGTSVAAPASNITYTLDRFIARPNSSTATTVTQVTDAPTGFQYSARVTRDSGQTGGLTRFETPLETKDIIRLRGQKVTISFYAKAGSAYSPTSSYLSVLLFEGNGTERARAITGYDNETTLVNSPKTLTTSWQRFTHTTTAEIASDTTQLALQFTASWSGTAPANDEYFITGIQLEADDAATPFENRSYGEELAFCQRYYQAYGRDTSAPFRINGAGNGGSDMLTGFMYPMEMRTTPTLNYFGGNTDGGNFNNYVNGSATSVTGPNSTDAGKYSVRWNFAGNGSFPNSAYWIDVGNGSSQFSWTMDAEL